MRDRIGKGFNCKELFTPILLVSWLTEVVVPSRRREFVVADEKFLFVSVPNGKISWQHKMQ